MYLLNKIVRVGDSLGKVISHLGGSGDVLVMDLETYDLNKLNLSFSDISVVEGRESSVEDFYDELANNYYFDDTIQELKALDEGNKTDALMSMTLKEAVKRNVFLTDLNDFDYDTFFYNIIKDYRL